MAYPTLVIHEMCKPYRVITMFYFIYVILVYKTQLGHLSWYEYEKVSQSYIEGL